MTVQTVHMFQLFEYLIQHQNCGANFLHSDTGIPANYGIKTGQDIILL